MNHSPSKSDSPGRCCLPCGFRRPGVFKFFSGASDNAVCMPDAFSQRSVCQPPGMFQTAEQEDVMHTVEPHTTSDVVAIMQSADRLGISEFRLFEIATSHGMGSRQTKKPLRGISPRIFCMRMFRFGYGTSHVWCADSNTKDNSIRINLASGKARTRRKSLR